MDKPSMRTRVRSLAKGWKDRVSASPDIWDSSLKKDQGAADHLDDVSDWLELPQGFQAPDDDWARYRKSSTFDLDQATDEFDESAWSVYE
jgi:hypothetical protein